jgi:hypothetical protein
MFRTSPAHLQEALHKRISVSVVCGDKYGLFSAVAYREGRGVGGFKPPRNSEVLIKLTLLHDEFHWDTIDHPPYCPDLAPSDFYLFLKMKEHLNRMYVYRRNTTKIPCNTNCISLRFGGRLQCFDPFVGSSSDLLKTLSDLHQYFTPNGIPYGLHFGNISINQIIFSSWL